MTYLLSLLYFLIIGFCVLPTHAQTPQIKNQKVIVFDYPPYMNEKTVDGKKGLEIDLFEHAAKNLNLHFEYVWLPIARAVTAMKEEGNPNKYIYIGTSKHFVKEIEDKKFSAFKIGNAKFVPFILKEGRIPTSTQLNLESLKQYKVAALRGSSVVNALKAAGISPMEVSTFNAFFQTLIKKRVDVSVVLDIAGEDYLKKSPKEVKEKIHMLDSMIYEIPLAVVISKTHPNYIKIYNELNDRFALMRSNGDVKRISEKYYGPGKVPLDFFKP